MRNSLVALTGVFILSFCISANADEKPEMAKELKKFAGEWTFVSVEAAGKKIVAEALNGRTVVFEGTKYSVKRGDEVEESATLKIDPTKSPKYFDVIVTEGPNKDSKILGIYEFDGDKLKVCFDPTGKKRPTEFKTAEDSSVVLVVHKKVKK